MGRRLLFGSGTAHARLGIVDGREIFPILGAEDDDDAANTGDDSDDDNASDEDDDDSDSDEGDKPAAKTRRNRTRTSEFNRIKRERNALLKEKAEREKNEREADLKTKSEAERAAAERDDAVKERNALKARHDDALVELEIIKKSGKKYDWADIEDVLNDKVLRAAIELGEDGEVNGVEEALRDLAKRKPHFLAKPADSNGKGSSNGNGNGRQQPPPPRTGGQPNTGGTGDDRAADRQRLAGLYPALQRLPQ